MIPAIASIITVPNTIIVMMRKVLNDGRCDLNGLDFF